MRGNIFGKTLSMTTFGESHGPCMGVVLDGVPAGLNISLGDLAKELAKRAPGRIKGTSTRLEADQPEILSGIYEGKTLGSPIAIIVKNINQRPKDYDELKETYRPGHADKTTIMKYGLRDHRGGGRSSGRETLSRVIGGYFASLLLPDELQVFGFIQQLGPFECHLNPWEIENVKGPYYFPSGDDKGIESFLLKGRSNGESYGGKVTIVINNCPPGLGEPAFDKLKADFSKAFLSIGSCVGFSYGGGESLSKMYGGQVSNEPRLFGGIEGGISNGEKILLHGFFRPPSTIGENAKKGRHDPCILPRVIPVLEAMVKFVLADHYLRQKAYSSYEQKSV